jgi:hypothetical protein
MESYEVQAAGHASRHARTRVSLNGYTEEAIEITGLLAP